jgi:hypothetical protein
MRSSGGGWSAFADVKRTGRAGNPGALEDVACATIAGDLHACAITADGNVWHTVRPVSSGATWQAFKNVRAEGAGNRGRRFRRVGCGTVDGLLHLCCVDDAVPGGSPGGLEVWQGGDIWHTIRNPVAEDPQCDAIRGAIGDRVTERENLLRSLEGLDPQDEQDRATIRDIFEHTDVLDDQINGLRLQALALGCGPAGRPLDWQPFGDVKRDGGAGSPNQPFYDVSCAGFNGELHVCATTLVRRVDLTADLFHTIRFLSSWQQFESVLTMTGRPWAANALVNRVGVSELLFETVTADPDTECERLRGAIGDRATEREDLLRSLEGLDPQDEQDRATIRDIFERTDVLDNELNGLRQQAQALGCR